MWIKGLVNAADLWHQHIDAGTISRLVYRHTLDETMFLENVVKLQTYLGSHFSCNYVLYGGLDCEPTRTVLTCVSPKTQNFKVLSPGRTSWSFQDAIPSWNYSEFQVKGTHRYGGSEERSLKYCMWFLVVGGGASCLTLYTMTGWIMVEVY
jgi:hypothetical protein